MVGGKPRESAQHDISACIVVTCNIIAIKNNPGLHLRTVEVKSGTIQSIWGFV